MKRPTVKYGRAAHSLVFGFAWDPTWKELYLRIGPFWMTIGF
jgi:hypothetical protein